MTLQLLAQPGIEIAEDRVLQVLAGLALFARKEDECAVLLVGELNQQIGKRCDPFLSGADRHILFTGLWRELVVEKIGEALYALIEEVQQQRSLEKGLEFILPAGIRLNAISSLALWVRVQNQADVSIRDPRRGTRRRRQRIFHQSKQVNLFVLFQDDVVAFTVNRVTLAHGDVPARLTERVGATLDLQSAHDSPSMKVLIVKAQIAR